ncbi:MAG: hypothetical protein ACOYMB_04840 [Patescibacteria group bacterium]
MKKLSVVFVMLLVAVSIFQTVSGQIQIFGKYTENGAIEPDFNVFGYGPKLDSLGKFKISYFALVEEKWAEGLIGVSYSPTKWCELGLQVGIETISSLYRTSGSVWIGNDKVSFFTCVERGIGADNWWYKSTVAYTFNKNVSLGLLSWRYNGTGVIAKYTINGVSVWVNPAYDFEIKVKRLTVGLDFKI